MPKNPVQFFALYPEDFQKDHLVKPMKAVHLGAYFSLILAAWDENPPVSLPDDDETLATLARVDDATWKKIKGRVMACFVMENGRWVQKRLRKEYEKALEAIASKKKKAKVAAEKRWSEQCQTDATSNAQAQEITVADTEKPMPTTCVEQCPVDAASNATSNAPSMQILESSPTEKTYDAIASVAAEADDGTKAKSKTRRPRKQPEGSHPESMRYFREKWKQRYGEDYVMDYGKDGEFFSWMLSAVGGDKDRLSRVIDRYIADSDEWLIVKFRHNTNGLRNNFNKWNVDVPLTATPATGRTKAEMIDSYARENFLAAGLFGPLEGNDEPN